ncbi:MAG TPA: pyridoxal-dependent decarboxylase, exosortase A system-associated [Candidatus Binatia bacterium]|nr:pyridoxal-dependent decarboxylase, exosortase A system-associated [Candidatus Binatia bacterium]
MSHAPILFPVDGDDMLIGGMPVRLLAERMGSTPFYAYDRALMSARVTELRAALPKDVRLHYAMKCNPMPDVVAHFVPIVDGVDVASASEMDVALAAGARHVSFAGPGKSNDDIERAVAAGIVLNIESERELRSAVKAGDALGKTPRLALRVNPLFELKASGMKMGGAPSQFGIDAERAPEVLKEIETSGVSFEGFHIFAGSQNLRADSLIETQAKTLKLTMELAAATPMKVKLANIGGGFGIPYAPGDKRLDIVPIGEALNVAMEEFRARMPDTEVAIELGRYLAGEAGVYVCRVVDKKISRGQVFLITDGGLHHHLAASGNFGQVIRRNYPVVAPGRMAAGERETAHVVGPLCTPLDLLGAAVDLPKLDVGDLVAVLQSGAYGLTASPTAFLSHPRPGEIVV